METSFIKSATNILGLICDMIGVSVMFFNTPELFKLREPDPYRGEKGMQFEAVEKTNQENKSRDKKSRFGMLLIVIGFLLQFISSTIPA